MCSAWVKEAQHVFLQPSFCYFIHPCNKYLFLDTKHCGFSGEPDPCPQRGERNWDFFSSVHPPLPTETTGFLFMHPSSDQKENRHTFVEIEFYVCSVLFFHFNREALLWGNARFFFFPFISLYMIDFFFLYMECDTQGLWYTCKSQNLIKITIPIGNTSKGNEISMLEETSVSPCSSQHHAE